MHAQESCRSTCLDLLDTAKQREVSKLIQISRRSKDPVVEIKESDHVWSLILEELQSCGASQHSFKYKNVWL